MVWKDKVIDKGGASSLVRLTMLESKYFQFLGIKVNILVLSCRVGASQGGVQHGDIIMLLLLIKAIVKMDVWFEAYLSYNLQGLPGDVFPGL